MVEKVGVEIDNAIREAGEQAAFDIGVHGINPELIKLLGKLKYRTATRRMCCSTPLRWPSCAE